MVAESHLAPQDLSRSSNEFKASFCFTGGRDGTYKILPAPVVSANYTLLLRFAGGTLNVCFYYGLRIIS
jgi:hypothetical protein